MKIVILEGHTTNPGDLDWTPVEHHGEVTVYDRTSRSEVCKRVGDAEAIVINKLELDKELLQQLSAVKCICLLATGFDNVDLEAASSLGIQVYNASDYGTESVAQHTFALLLALNQHICEYNESVKSGDWHASYDFCYHLNNFRELKSMTLGLIGYGKIGARVGEIASAFGMEVMAHVQHPEQHTGVNTVSLEELCEKCAILSLHLPLTDESESMINSELLSTLKRGSFLINTSRGPLLVENDVVVALDNGILGGAAIDVCSYEPPEYKNSLILHPKCLVTPHIAWTSVEARRRLIQMVAKNLKCYKEGNYSRSLNQLDEA